MFVYVCAMLGHDAHCVVRPTTERRDEKGKGEGEGGSVRLMCLLSQPGSSASNYDFVKTSAQLAEARDSKGIS